MSFRVLLSPDPFAKRCFSTVGKALTWAGKRTGAEGTILLGAHTLNQKMIKEDWIIYNFEQVDPSVAVFKEGSKYIDLLRNRRVFDYSKVNIERLKDLYGIEAEFVPLGYAPTMHNPAITGYRRNCEEFDRALFYGSMNRRRDKFLETLEDKVDTFFGLWGDYLSTALAKSSVLVNVHFYTSSIFEIVRCCEALANGVPVLSELSIDSGQYGIDDMFFDLPEIRRRVMEGDIPCGPIQLSNWINNSPTMLDTMSGIDWKP